MSASELGASSPSEGVSCALQYWDECLESFQTYSEFHLSEDNMTHLNLPTVGDKRRCAVSHTWRVVLYYDHDEDEDEAGFAHVEKEVIVTPKSLVSVIRVDSYFNSGLIPRVQAALHLPSASLELYNQLHFYGRKLPRDGGNDGISVWQFGALLKHVLYYLRGKVFFTLKSDKNINFN